MGEFHVRDKIGREYFVEIECHLKGRIDERTQRMTMTSLVVNNRERANVICINMFDYDLINYLQHCKLQLHPATLHLCSRV